MSDWVKLKVDAKNKRKMGKLENWISYENKNGETIVSDRHKRR